MENDALVVGIDVGTGGCKVTVIDANGRMLTQSRVAHDTLLPIPGWVEQRPAGWLLAVLAAMDSAMSVLSPRQRDGIRAIGFSAPTHVAVLSGHGDEVLRPAIMWNDQRSGDQARALKTRPGTSIDEIAGNTPSATWTLPHLLWLRENEPQILENTTRLRFMKDWVREQLSVDSGQVTDRIDAEGALLLDVVTHAWSPELVDLAGISLGALPAIVDPTVAAGRLSPEYTNRWGLGSDVAMIVGTTDTAAELLAAGALRAGDAVVKLATAGNVALVSDDAPHDTRLLGYSHVPAGLVYLNSATSAAAEALRWAVESFVPRAPGEAVDYAAVDGAVARVDPGSGGVIFAPFLHGERAPRFDEKLRAGFVGLTAAHSWPHAVRAVMEGVAFSLRDAASLHRSLPRSVTLVGGGGRSAVWPQILADILDRRIMVADDADSSMGAALIAGVGIELFESYESATRLAETMKRPVSPHPARARFYDRRFEDYLLFANAIADVSHRLAGDPWTDSV